jgi:hypothetical protein
MALETRHEQINNMLSEATATMSNKFGILGRLDGFADNIESIHKALADVMNSMKSLMIDERFVEIFTDSDIRHWYMQTDLTAKEVMKAIGAYFPDKKNLSLETVSAYIKCEFPKEDKDNTLKMRSFLGKYFRNEAFRKANKATSKA